MCSTSKDANVRVWPLLTRVWPPTRPSVAHFLGSGQLNLIQNWRGRARKSDPDDPIFLGPARPDPQEPKEKCSFKIEAKEAFTNNLRFTAP